MADRNGDRRTNRIDVTPAGDDQSRASRTLATLERLSSVTGYCVEWQLEESARR